MGERHFGMVNGHTVGRVVKEAMRRATVVIRSERAHFDAHVKQSYSGTMDDVFTSADTAAQEIYLRTFQECFPDYGVIGEENKLRAPPKNGCTLHFTVDPLDGTRAFIRRQSHGVATMVALADGQEVLSAYIGDINTEEVYGYRPGADSVWRITRLDTFEKLGREGVTPLKKSYALLRDPLGAYGPRTQSDIPARFKNYEVMGSSIGTWAARLWKNEVSALFMQSGWETPWDSTPVIGISRKLGYAFLRPDMSKASGWRRYEPIISTEVYERMHDTLIVHESNLAEVYSW